MTLLADDGGLATAGCHHLDPARSLAPSPTLEALECSNVMNLDAVVRAAELAGISQETFENLCASAPDVPRTVVEDFVLVPIERNAAPLRYQRRLPGSLDLDP